jgi:TPR repeat protein
MPNPILSQNKLSIMSALCAVLLFYQHPTAKAETVTSDHGITNPVEESIEYQLEKLRTSRTNGTLTVLCWKAHEMDKAGMHEEALPVMITCAKEGHDISMLELAKLYETGSGVKKDLKQAVYWLKKSSDRGFSTGQLYYGIALLTGKGVSQDIPKGQALIQKAAAQNDAHAIELINSGYDVEAVIPDAGVDLSRSESPLY